MTRTRSQRGTASVELAILVPVLVILLGLMIAGGRIWFARATVTEAAYSAARAASLARTPGEAAIDGRNAGQQSMATGGLECISRSVQVDVNAFSVPVGQPATITSSVFCTVSFGDVLLPGMPGALTLRADGASALDTYRGRG